MNTVKERPILFSGPMVRAILDGKKSQTRRVVKPQPIPFGESSPFTQQCIKEHVGKPWMPVGGVFQDKWKKPYGEVGGLLWVRETFTIVPSTAYARSDGIHQIVNPSDRDNAAVFKEGFDRSRGGIRWKSPLFMPRWASRITLEVTHLRVERLQDISEEDAKAEGVEVREDRSYSHAEHGIPYTPFRTSYSSLWESINGPGSWDLNPFVWVIEFKRVEGKR